MNLLAYIYNVAPEETEPEWQIIGHAYRLNSDVVPVIAFFAYEALQKENAELKEINDSLHRSSQFTYEWQTKSIADLKSENEAKAKRIAELEGLFHQRSKY